MTRRLRIVLTLGVVLVVAAGLFVFGGHGEKVSGAVIPVAQRRTPIPVIGAAIGSGQVDVAALRGAPVVLNFWASWCGPCQAEQPVLERAAAATRSQGVHFVGINIREPNQAQARSFLDEYQVSYPSVVDTGFAFSSAYGVPAPPATFILDADGRVAVRILGEITSADELVALINRVAQERA